MTAILAFDKNNRLAVRKLGSKAGLAFTGANPAMALQRLEGCYAEHSDPTEQFSLVAGGRAYKVRLCQISGNAKDSEIECWPLDRLQANPGALAPSLAAMLPKLEPLLMEIPYLHLGSNDFIYKFRPEKERNSDIYNQDSAAEALYQSKLCEAIKVLSRKQERTARNPVELDFGAVSYVIPSHFGFCLGVKNAIERAYETLNENPGKRVFMLSELIHNPFVNEDLSRRGLRYLQTDKGVPLTVNGLRADQDRDAALLWDTLTPDDVVIIPAFGATDADKAKLVRKGIPVYPHDATCMLVEKVWKAARSYGREGYTVIIHGKHEHEETKATFSNTIRTAHALIVRNMEEAQTLGRIIAAGGGTPEARALFEQAFAGKHSQGFDPASHLERIAVVNQTTLLSSETLAIIDHLKEVYQTVKGDASLVGGNSRRDTLCYATQVNQDALSQALELPLDAAVVIGGKNSSNTYQLYRLAEAKLGAKAFFIQSEGAIKSAGEVEHYVFPSHSQAGKSSGTVEVRPLWTEMKEKRRVLITGGASCPDGIIQQVICRINRLHAPETLKSISEVLASIEKQ